MFWNMFREGGNFTCYYEPFHEHLLEHVRSDNKWVDPTHYEVDNYWTEYAALPGGLLERRWQPWFGRKRWCIDELSEHPEIYDYLRELIDWAPKTPVLKFVRAGLRARWLRNKFPDAIIIHVVRNPRAVWKSMVGAPTVSNLDCFSGVPSEKRGFYSYMLMASAELQLDTSGHPYSQFFILWMKQFQEVSEVADITWWYEDAVADYDRWFDDNCCESSLLGDVSKIQIYKKDYEMDPGGETWFLEKEAESIRRYVCNKTAIPQVRDGSLILYRDQIQALEDECFELSRANHQLTMEVSNLRESFDSRLSMGVERWKEAYARKNGLWLRRYLFKARKLWKKTFR